MNSIRVQWGQPLEIYSKYNYKHKHKYQVQEQAIFAHILASMIAIGTQGRCLKLEPSAVLISHNFMHYWHTAQPRYSLIYEMENRIWTLVFELGAKCAKSHWTVNTCNGTGATATHPLNSITRPLSPPFVQNYYYHITILWGQLLHCLSSWLLLYATNSISIAFCAQLLRLLFCSMAQFHSHLDRITISLFSSLATEMNRTA